MADECGDGAVLARLTRRRHAGSRQLVQMDSSTVLVVIHGKHQDLIMAQPALPDDILHVLCEELASQDQFDTLFNCACASRTLAVPALTHLYR